MPFDRENLPQKTAPTAIGTAIVGLKKINS